MKSIGYTMTIDHVTITELPKVVDRKARRSLMSLFERYTHEHRMVHLLILPNGGELDFASLGFLAELNEFVQIAGGEIGLVTWRPRAQRILQAAGVDRYFRCFTSVEAGVESMRPSGSPGTPSARTRQPPRPAVHGANALK